MIRIEALILPAKTHVYVKNWPSNMTFLQNVYKMLVYELENDVENNTTSNMKNKDNTHLIASNNVFWAGNRWLRLLRIRLPFYYIPECGWFEKGCTQKRKRFIELYYNFRKIDFRKEQKQIGSGSFWAHEILLRFWYWRGSRKGTERKLLGYLRPNTIFYSAESVK